MKLKIQLLITLIAVLFLSGCFFAEPYPNERNISTSTNETKNLDNKTNDAMSNIENDKIYFQVTNKTEYIEKVDCSFDSIFYCNDNIKSSNDKIIFDIESIYNTTINNLTVYDLMKDVVYNENCNIEITNLYSNQKYSINNEVFLESNAPAKFELTCNNADFKNNPYTIAISFNAENEFSVINQIITVTNKAEERNFGYNVILDDFPKYVGNYEIVDNYYIESFMGNKDDSFGISIEYTKSQTSPEYEEQEIIFFVVNDTEVERELLLEIQESMFLIDIEGNKLITDGGELFFWFPHNTFYLIGFEIEYDDSSQIESEEQLKEYVLNNDFYKTFIKEFPSNNSRVEKLSLIRNIEEAFE